MNQDIHSLEGKLLLAMPSMGDPRFHQSVIFLCAHDAEGSMGLIINHVYPDMVLGDFYKQLNGTISANPAHDQQAVLIGGPVETSRGFLLHSSDYTSPDTIQVTKDYGVSGTLDALRSYSEGRPPNSMLFMLGYCGWSEGQLDQEIRENSWLVIDANHELIFNTPSAQCWNRAMLLAGIDPLRLSVSAGHA